MNAETSQLPLIEQILARGPPALFLDFDGTLVDIAPRPDAVRPDARLVPLLARLHAELDGSLAIVTGRPVVAVDAFLAPLRLPVAGLHGFEMRADPSGTATVPAAAELDPARHSAAALVATWPGLLVEDKGLTIALHYRAAPAAGPSVVAWAATIVDASRGALKSIDGKMVVELMPVGSDKGAGIRRLLANPPFAGRRPVFLGDDVTDEAGFLAVAELGGLGVRVGAPIAATAARYRLGDVAAVLELLDERLRLAPDRPAGDLRRGERGGIRPQSTLRDP